MKKFMQVIGIIFLILCVIAIVFCIGVCIAMMIKDMSFVEVCREFWETIKSWFVGKPKAEDSAKTLLTFLGVR